MKPAVHASVSRGWSPEGVKEEAVLQLRYSRAGGPPGPGTAGPAEAAASHRLTCRGMNPGIWL